MASRTWAACSGRVHLAYLIFLLPCILWLYAPIAQGGNGAALIRQPVVRIGLKTDVAQVILSCDGKIRVWRRGTGLRASELGPGVRLRLLPTRVASETRGASSGTRTVPGWAIALSKVREQRLGVFTEELIFEPISPGRPIRVDGKPYRGEVLVRISKPGAFTVINALHIEDYLRGVVPPEIGNSPDLPVAALKVQAVASRSYALFHVGRHNERGFDLHAGTQDQVYGGVQVETEVATQAVMATRGILALHRGRPIRANYCSTCGGATEASGRVWPGEVFPYLRPVRDHNAGKALCEGSTRFRWTETWNCSELKEIILRHLPEEDPKARLKVPTEVRGLKVTKRSSSGRAEILEIKTDTGKFHVRGDRIRWVLRRGNDQPMWSTLFGMLKKETRGDHCTITLDGGGYGHGVGMCQTGAIMLARQGRSAPQILRHYYRGITLDRWW